jgi:uncharacterized C2H2 Zn-finger protein
MCPECNDNLVNLTQMLDTAKGLNRLFSGLMEENSVDLNLLRLNAYRAHFNLDSIVSHTNTTSETLALENEEDQSNYEYVEYKLDDSDLKDETTETIVEELDSSLIVKDEFDVEEEVYLEEEITESQDSEYFLEEQENVSTDSVTETVQTEDEKLFTFQCHLCPDYAPEFLKMKHLDAHCKSVHDSIPMVKCCSSECDSVLSTWRRLMIHKEKHFPSNERFSCPQCQKNYATQIGYEKHLNSHNIHFICSHCGKEFKEAKTLRWHEQTHSKPLEERKNHECPYGCGLRFITKQACKNHVGAKHEQNIIVSCKVPDCNKSFFTRKAYHEHTKNSHGERKFLCDQCNFKARTKSALNIHKDIHRVGDTFSCDLCNSVFSGYRRLKAHMICHSMSTPFQCQHCDSSFKRSKDLRSHTLVHTKE